MAWAFTESEGNFLDLFIVAVDNIPWEQIQGTSSSSACIFAEKECSYVERECSGELTQKEVSNCESSFERCVENLIECSGEL